MSEMLLDIKDLSVQFRQSGNAVNAVNNVSLHVGEGETVALVGESSSDGLADKDQ